MSKPSKLPSTGVFLLLLGIASFLTTGLTHRGDPAVVFHGNNACTIVLPPPYPASNAGVVTDVIRPDGRRLFTCNAMMPAGAPLPKAALTFTRGDCFFRLTPGGTAHATCTAF